VGVYYAHHIVFSFFAAVVALRSSWFKSDTSRHQPDARLGRQREGGPQANILQPHRFPGACRPALQESLIPIDGVDQWIHPQFEIDCALPVKPFVLGILQTLPIRSLSTPVPARMSFWWLQTWKYYSSRMATPNPLPRILRFGPFEADLQTRELRKAGHRVLLQDKPFQVLTALLERPGELVSRDDLRQLMWSADTFLDFDNSLNTAIAKLREALGDSAEEHRYIETLARRGYRFVAPVAAGPMVATGTSQEGVKTEFVIHTPEDDAEVHRRKELSTAAKTTWLVPFGGGVIAVIALAAGIIWSNAGGLADRLHVDVAPPGIQSLAVLPFHNLSGDQEQEYFADGMTDELIIELSKISEIRVISRTSVVPYKETRKSLPEIARELNVDAVVEGTVMHSGERVRLTAKLMRVKPEEPLWAERYERNLSDVLTMQNEMARTIAAKILVKLTQAERANLALVRPVNPEAYSLYLKGRYSSEKPTSEGLRRSLRYFEQAIEKAPQYAAAYGGLAESYNLLGYLNIVPPSEAFPRAEIAARQALTIDQNAAGAHVALGFALLEYDWNRTGADREFTRAIELNPNYSAAYLWHGYVLLLSGRLDDAKKAIQQAKDLDPLSLQIRMIDASAFYFGRQYNEAIEKLRDIVELDPYVSRASHLLGYAYWKAGQPGQAFLAFTKGDELAGYPSQKLEALQTAYLMSGLRGYWSREIEVLMQQSNHQYVSPVFIAMNYACLGNSDQTFQWLNKAYEERSFKLLEIKLDPAWDSFRSDRRFKNLLRKIE
jgi:TolB-like protein/DNA-binding winged helix-turn-helix (wHTH) protein/Flp pilus assembly protein TadD